MTNIAALNKVTHKNLRLTQDKTFKHAQKQHISSLQVHEFVAASLYYPIVFVKDEETGEFRASALLGLQPNENLFYQASDWSAHYVPTSMRGYPFLIAPETATLCADLDSYRFSDSEGDRLFNDDSSETDALKNIANMLAEFLRQSPVSRDFIRYLAEKSLLSAFNLTINIQNKPYQLNGLYAVDQKKLNELKDSEFITLKKKNYLPAIYAHLASLGNIESMVHIKSRQTQA